MSLALKGSSAGSATRTVRSSTIHGTSSRAVVVPRRAPRGANVTQAFAGGSSGPWNEDAMRDMLRDMAQQFQQGSSSGGKGSPQDMLLNMAQQFMQASSSGSSGSPLNASSWAPPGINININSGFGDGWKAGGPAGRSSRPSGNQASTRPNSSSTTSSSSSSSSQRGMLTLALDVVTTDDAYVIYADIPGVTKSDLSIKCSKDPRVLTISGSRPTPTSQQEYKQQQRPFGTFERSWPLPVDADAGRISAKVSEGVLRLTVKRVVKQEDEGQEIFIS